MGSQIETLPPGQNLCTEQHTCSCGCAPYYPHEVGKDGCVHRMELLRLPVATGEDFYAWEVAGTKITDYTLRQQRGYRQHACGCWSHWNDSKNSLEWD